MQIRAADRKDKEMLSRLDRHIRPEELEVSISLGRVLVAEENGQLAGWLRWNLFWDNTPFCTMLVIDQEFRGKSYGTQLMEHWEKDMKKQGYGMLFTSTQVDETAQHFYRKLGYKDCGGFVIDIPLYAQPMEMILIKAI